MEVLAVVGATASGKTDLAVDLARELRGEIISADSRQVYKKLDAGTAKPILDTEGKTEGVAYHLLDVADLSERFDAGTFARLAGSVLEEIRARGRTAIVAGGTGLYVRALLEGLSDMPSSDPEIRKRLEAQALQHGRAWLHDRLSKIDPKAAAKISANNIQRTLRALEVYELTGKPISSFWNETKQPSPHNVLLIEWPADQLKERIVRRAEDMWPAMLTETRALLAEGYSGAEPGFQSLGYREAVACLRGEISSEQGTAELIRATCAYAKRQRTWFRHQTPGAAVITGGSRQAMLSQALTALGLPHATTIAR